MWQKTEPQNMTASYQPTAVPNKDLGIWNEPVKIVINSSLYNVITRFVIGDAKRKKCIPKSNCYIFLAKMGSAFLSWNL